MTKTIDLTVFPQKTFRESLAIYDEWNFVKNSLPRLTENYKQNLREIVAHIVATFQNTHPEQRLHFLYNSNDFIFQYALEEYFEDGHLFVNFYVKGVDGELKKIASCHNSDVLFEVDGLTAFIEIKNTYDFVDAWPIQGFYESFIATTREYLEMVK
jgi:hypothetical protein